MHRAARNAGVKTKGELQLVGVLFAMSPSGNSDNEHSHEKGAIPDTVCLIYPVNTEQEQQVNNDQKNQNGTRYIHRDSVTAD